MVTLRKRIALLLPDSLYEKEIPGMETEQLALDPVLDRLVFEASMMLIAATACFL